MVESQGNPTTDPIAFWTNGGPGCSGLYGFLTENGPFQTHSADLSLTLNPYSWNKVANMVFIEQPCGVGYSYSDQSDPYKEDGGDYITDDEQSAADNYALVQAFFDRFPQYRVNDLYISSESYGGHYMPQLAKQIVDHNQAGNDIKLNFKGFLVGNPGTTFSSIIPAGLDTYWGHQIISQPLYDGFVKNCREAPHFNMTVCEGYYLAMYEQIGELNPYALDYDVCLEDDSTNAGRARKYGRSQRTWMMNHALPALFSKLEGGEPHNEILSEESQARMNAIRKHIGLSSTNEEYVPCAEDYMTAYMNQDSVKKAIHVNTNIEWSDCSMTLRYKTADRHDDQTPLYNYLIDGPYDLNILVVSGDDDSVCATIGTQNWIWDLGYEVKGRPWQTYKVNGQTGGYLTQWKNTKMAFATVHNAGHEVPTYQPEVAYYLWENYLKGALTDC